MGVLEQKIKRNERKIKRVRKKISGTKERPRVSFSQSNKYIYVQAVNDVDGKTLAYVSSLSKEIKVKNESKKNKKIAEELAEGFYKKLETAKIKEIVLDRRKKKFHGVVKSFSDKLREKGIKF